MTTEITLQLLNNRPKVELNGSDIHIPETSRELLIYLAVENKAEYDRDELTLRLYESLEFRSSFRKTALGYLPKEIKGLCIWPTRHTINFDSSHVRVDVHDFQMLVESIPENYSSAAFRQMAPQLVQACDLYQDDFLKGYEPALYRLNPWLQEKRNFFRTLFHRLLEKLIQYQISTQDYNSALTYAQRWHDNDRDANLPLQYLIWLAANLDAHTLMLKSVEQLEHIDTARSGIIGYTPTEWRRLFERKMKPDVSILQLNTSERIEVQELLALASDRLPGRNESLERVFDTLFVSQTASLLTITGERGMGKTAFAETVGEVCKEAEIVDNVIVVGMTTENDFEQVLNAIALQFDKPHLLSSNYRNKYVSIEKLLETESNLLILDQQELDDAFTEDFKAHIKVLSEHVPVLMCCHTAWDNVENISLESLNAITVGAMFKSHIDALDNTRDSAIIQTITGGSPLAVKWLIGGMKAANLTLGEAIAQIAKSSAMNPLVDTPLHHKNLLQWCWRILDSPAQMLLASFMDFDLLEGPDQAQLRELHPALSEVVVGDALRQLEAMSLIEIKGHHGEQPFYRWHSLLHEFLIAIDALTQVTDDPLFKSRFRQRFCTLYGNYLSENALDYQKLDLCQRNLLHAFDLGFEQGNLTLGHVNALLNYLITRGFYRPAHQIAEQTLQTMADYNSTDYVELLLNSAKVDIKRGEFQVAEHQLNEAWERATSLGSPLHQAEIYQQLGITAKKYGRMDQSREFLEAALEQARQSERADLLCTILANLGSLAVQHAQYDEAKRLLQESLDVAMTAGKLQVVEYTQTALGLIADEALDFSSGLEYFAAAQVTAQQMEIPERQAYIYFNTGATYYYLEQYDDALENLKNGLEIAQRLEHEELIANILRNLGRLEAVKGNMLQAERCYREALIAASDRDLTWLVADVMLDMGKLGFQIHNQAYCRQCFQTALTQALELENYDLVAEALFGIGVSIATEAWIIGPDDVDTTVQVIIDGWDGEKLWELRGLPITLKQFKKAEFLFQHGLVNFPQIKRYRVAEALAHLIGSV